MAEEDRCVLCDEFQYRRRLKRIEEIEILGVGFSDDGKNG